MSVLTSYAEEELVMIVAKLVFILFALAGIAIGALSHPLIYKWVMGGPETSADHKSEGLSRIFSER